MGTADGKTVSKAETMPQTTPPTVWVAGQGRYRTSAATLHSNQGNTIVVRAATRWPNMKWRIWDTGDIRSTMDPGFPAGTKCGPFKHNRHLPRSCRKYGAKSGSGSCFIWMDTYLDVAPRRRQSNTVDVSNFEYFCLHLTAAMIKPRDTPGVWIISIRLDNSQETQ